MNDLQEAILKQRAETGISRPEQAKLLDIGRTSLWHIEEGNNKHVSIESRNELREKLGLPKEKAPVMVDPCPTCGVVHQLQDCQGAKVQHVRRRPKTYTKWADMPTSQLAEAIRNRKEL